MNDEQSHSLEDRLRGMQPATPVLDRDLLMFRAGQRAAPRASRVWPVLTLGSWAACAAVVGLFLFWPAEVVVKTRVVERIVRVPVERESTPSEPTLPDNKQPASAAESRLADVRKEPFWSLDRLDGPLTAGAWQEWRNEDYRAVASVERSQPISTESNPAPSPPKTYGELRREMMGGDWDERMDIF